MKRSFKIVVLTFLGSLVLAACSENNNQPSSNFDDAVEMVDVAQEADRTISEGGEEADVIEVEDTDITDPDEAESVEQQQYIVYSAYLDYESINYEDARREIENLLQESGAQTQYVNESQYEPFNPTSAESLPMMRQLNATYRIPQEEFEQVITRLLEVEAADIVSSTQGSEDATRDVMDLNIRIEAVEDRLERLNQLLEQAEEIEDILAIQTEVENAIVERDQYLAQRNSITNQAAMSTLNVSLREVYMTQVEESEAYSFGNRLQTTFRNAITGTRRLFQELVLLIISLIPVLILLALLFLIYWFLIRPIVKRRRKNRPAKDVNDSRKRKVPSFAPAKSKEEKLEKNKSIKNKTNSKTSFQNPADQKKKVKVTETSHKQSDEQHQFDTKSSPEKTNPLVTDPDKSDPTSLKPVKPAEEGKEGMAGENKDTPENPS